MSRREEYSYMVGIGRPEIMMGAHMCSASLSGTEKSIWEHYNELTAKLDATQKAEWDDMANGILIFVCPLPPYLYAFPVANVQVVSSLCGRPCNVYRLRPPTIRP